MMNLTAQKGQIKIFRYTQQPRALELKVNGLFVLIKPTV